MMLVAPEESDCRAVAPGLRFVVGCERSGTTLLSVLLDRHSQLAMTPETHFFLSVVPRKGRINGFSHADILYRFFSWGRTADLHLDRARIRERFSALPPTFGHLFAVAMDEYAGMHRKPCAGEKTPFHLWKVPLILHWFPDAKIINLVRDGRDVVFSILDAPWTSEPSIRRQSFKWVKSVRYGAWLGKKYPSSVMTVRFEDLLREPEAVMKRIDAFLGLPFEPGQLDEHRQSAVVPEWEQDWKGRATQSLDTSRIGAWTKRATPEERLIMNSVMGRSLRTLGYEDLDIPAVPTGTRWANGLINFVWRIGLYRLWYNLGGRYMAKAKGPHRQDRVAWEERKAPGPDS